MKKTKRFSILFSIFLIIGMMGYAGCGSGGGGGGEDGGNDRDGDGIVNASDNCPDISNDDQTDSDNDGIGNACDEDKVNVSSIIEEAKKALEEQDYAKANTKFEEAYNLNPDDSDANFGLGVTDLLMLIENQDVKDIINDWEGTVPTIEEILSGDWESCSTINDDYDYYGCYHYTETCTTIFGFNTSTHEGYACSSGSAKSSPKSTSLKTMISEGVSTNFNFLEEKLPEIKTSILNKVVDAAKAPSTAPSISEMQEVINNTIMPVIESCIANIRKVEGIGYTFTVTPAMTDNAESVDTILDDGEFYAMDAVLSTVKAVMSVLTAYNMDVDYNAVELDPLSALDDASFLTLKTDGVGSEKMNTALSSFIEAVDKLEMAYNFVESDDSDIETDNGITFDDWSSDDHKNAVKLFDALQMVLAGQVTFSISDFGTFDTYSLTNGTTTIEYSEEDWDYDEDFSVKVDITKAFTNPLDRTDLPSLDYDMSFNSALSNQYEEPMCTEEGLSDECDVMITGNFPDLTLNGIFPEGIPHPDSGSPIDGVLLFNDTIILDSSIWGLDDALTSDGQNLIGYRNVYSGYPSNSYTREILEIDPSNGDVTGTYATLDSSYYEAGYISWIDDMAYLNGEVWAVGGYYTYSYYYDYNYGVFKIDPVTGLASTMIPSSDYWYYNINNITSDGTYLYLSGYEGVIRLSPTDTEIPTDYWLDLDSNDGSAYGGGYLWIDGLKIDPSDGEILKSYISPDGDISTYMNGKFYAIEDDKIHVYTAP